MKTERTLLPPLQGIRFWCRKTVATCTNFSCRSLSYLQSQNWKWTNPLMTMKSYTQHVAYLRMNNPPPSLHKVFVYLVNEEVHGIWIVLNHLQETWKPLPSFWRAIPHGFHHALYHSAGKGWQLDLRQCPLFCQIKWCVQFWIKLGVHMSGAVAIWKQQQWCQTLGMQCSVVVQNVLPVHWPVHATTMQSIHIIYVHDFLPSLLPLPCCYCIATTLLIPYHMLLHC